MNNRFDTSDVRVGVTMEVDRASVATVEQDIARVLGAGQTQAGGHKSGMEVMADAMSRLSSVLSDMMRAMGDSTKHLSQQVQLRERELQILKEQKATTDAIGGGKSGGGGSGGGTFYGPKGEFGGTFTDRRPDQDGDGGGGPSRRFGHQMLAAAAYASGQSGRFYEMMKSGFHGTDVARFITGAITDLPVVGSALGALNLIPEGMAEHDRYKDDALGVWRNAGERSRFAFRQNWETERSSPYYTKYGIDRAESARLFSMAGRYGQDNDSGLVQLQGRYGLAGEGAGLMTALKHGGGLQTNNDSLKVFAEILGMAIGSNLDRGRWGEAFTAMTKAAQSIQSGEIDRAGLETTEAYINQLGGRFLGDTSAHNSLRGLYQGLQSGAGGDYGHVLAVQAAMSEGAGSYTEAWMKAQIGPAAGGVSLPGVLRQLAGNPLVQAYLQDGSERSLSTATFALSKMLPGYKSTDIRAALINLRTSSGVSIDPNLGAQALDKGLPHWESDPARSRAYSGTPFVRGPLGGVLNDNTINSSEAEFGMRSPTSASTDATGVGGGSAAGPANVDAILRTIRTMESGGRYHIQNAAGGDASGAYQFKNKTWNNYGGYKRAMDAPPEVQDAKARQWVQKILADNNGDVNMVPASWYAGQRGAKEFDWDTVLPGNRSSIRQYVNKWRKSYDQTTSSPGPVTSPDGGGISIDVHVYDHKSTATVRRASEGQRTPGTNYGSKSR